MPGLCRNLLFLTAGVLLHAAPTAFGAMPPRVAVTDGTVLHGDVPGATYLRAPAATTLTLAAALERLSSSAALAIPASSNFGYTTDEIWMAVPVDLQGLTVGSPQLALLNPDLVEAEIWLVGAGGEPAHVLAGARYEQRRFVHYPMLALPQGARSATVVVRMRGAGLLHFDAVAGSSALVMEAMGPAQVFVGIHTGIILLLVVYHLLIFASFRRQVYLSYVAYALAMGFEAVLGAGWVDGLLGGSGIVALTYEPVAIALPALPALLFTLSILNLRRHPRLYRIGVALTAWSGLLIVAAALFGPPVVEVCQLSFLVDLVFLITAAIVAMNAGEASAAPFLVGWSIFGACIIIWLLTSVGVVPPSHFTSNAAHYGNIVEFLCLSRAIVRHLERLRGAETRAVRSAEETDWFRHLVRTVSHDLTNPLFVAAEFAKHGLATDSKADMRRALERVHGATRTMQAITGQVRSFASLESGKFVLTLSRVAVGPLIDEVRTNFGEALERKGLALVVDIEDPTLLVRVDATTLVNSVLANLVSNAIKFSEPGGEVAIRVSRRDGSVIVDVTDGGIGMTPVLAMQIFDPNKPTSLVGTAGEQGTGFGMLLAKRFIELYGATLAVDSRAKADYPDTHGTTIRLTFPATDDEPSAPLLAPKAA